MSLNIYLNESLIGFTGYVVLANENVFLVNNAAAVNLRAAHMGPSVKQMDLFIGCWIDQFVNEPLNPCC